MHRHHDRQRKGRVDGRSDSVCERCGRLCHNDAVEDSPEVLSLSLLCVEKNIRCKSGNCVPIVTVSTEVRTLDVSTKVSGDRSRKVLQPDVPIQENPGDRLHHPGALARETEHIRFQTGFNLPKMVPCLKHHVQCRDHFISCPTSSDFVLSLLFCSMQPAVKFFQRFQAGLLANVISSLVWTLAGDQQCASKLSVAHVWRRKKFRSPSSLRGTSPNAPCCLV